MASTGRASQQRPRGRANGEGSIFPYRNMYAAYVWVTTPEGARKRDWVYGKDREQVHAKWLKLHAAAAAGPVVTKSQTVGEYLRYWLAEVVVEPDLRRTPSTRTKAMCGSTSFQGWEISGSISSASAMCGHG